MNECLPTTISEITLNVVLSIFALIMTIVGVALSIFFFRWAREEQKETSNYWNLINKDSTALMSTIKEKLELLRNFDNEIIKNLIKYLTETNSQLLAQSVKQALINEKSQEVSKKKNDSVVITPNLIDEVSKESFEQIKSTNQALASLDKTELSVLYSISISQNLHDTVKLDCIAKETELTITEIEAALKGLKRIKLIDDNNNISSSQKNALNSFFNIDDYPGMRYVEKINAFTEMIKRLPK